MDGSSFNFGDNTMITGGTFSVITNVTNTKAIQPIYDKVSPNAILNAGGRTDVVRCYPGTREGVIARIEKWHRAQDLLGGHHIFWLRGSAGTGKSAIVQTLAERCLELGVPVVNFFFFRADPTRNHSDSLVATLLFQLFKLFPQLEEVVGEIITKNPIILRQSLQDQLLTLIGQPLRDIASDMHQSDQLGPPIMLIDGLDECNPEHGDAEQSSLLRILHNIATKDDFPFIILVASRQLAHLTMTFNEVGSSPDSIILDDYNPFGDIRQYLFGEYSRIGQTHSRRDTPDTNWPPMAATDSIARKSSGQFAYATAVVRFIETSPASPEDSLDIMLGLPPVTKIPPFTTFNNLCNYISSWADDFLYMRDNPAADKLRKEAKFKLAISPEETPFMLVPWGYMKDYGWLYAQK